MKERDGRKQHSLPPKKNSGDGLDRLCMAVVAGRLAAASHWQPAGTGQSHARNWTSQSVDTCSLFICTDRKRRAFIIA